MKINIIGGGPAGLYFAILMKKADAAHQIKIYERNGPDDTFGWGVVFSGKTLANLRAADEDSHAEITKQFEAWDNVDVVHRSERSRFTATAFPESRGCSCSRSCSDALRNSGVEIEFRTEIHDIEALRNDCDLLLAADGVNSTVRLRYENSFSPSSISALIVTSGTARINSSTDSRSRFVKTTRACSRRTRTSSTRQPALSLSNAIRTRGTKRDSNA